MPNLEYIPAPAKPEGFDTKLEEIGGRVPSGDLRYRAVWGMDEKEFFNGREDTKYCSFKEGHVGLPRWVIERWIPPTLFSPLEWREYKELGPYPSRGVYILLFVVREEETGDFAPLDDRVLERLRHDHFYLLNQRVEVEEYARQSERREAMRRRRDEYLEAETKENWKEYFAKEDYINASREYSFAERKTPAAVKAGETRTPAGLILPAGVSAT